MKILLSTATVVSIALGFFQDFGVARDESDGPPVDWVEGVAIMVAIMIVVSKNVAYRSRTAFLTSWDTRWLSVL